jgi:hypothetical protein
VSDDLAPTGQNRPRHRRFVANALTPARTYVDFESAGSYLESACSALATRTYSAYRR